jgi:micrococcal nuclease
MFSMKTLMIPFAIFATPFAAIALIAISISAAPKEYGEVVVTEIVNVYDGDTFHVNIKGWPDVCGKNIGVRILGIDTPEMHDKDPAVKATAIKAKAYARQLLEGAKEIRLTNLKRDKYFRLLANVKLDGHDFSKLMLDSGLAKEYDGGTKDEWTEDDIKKS